MMTLRKLNLVFFPAAAVFLTAMAGPTLAQVSRQTFKLTPSDAAADDEFGGSVALSGNTALVASDENDDNGTSSGSAYLFDISTGSQIAKLTPSDGAAEDCFGSSVAISGNTALVGCATGTTITAPIPAAPTCSISRPAAKSPS